MARMEHVKSIIAILTCVGVLTLQGCSKSSKSEPQHKVTEPPHKVTAAPTPEPQYKVTERGVYSNSKYLADLQTGMSLSKCKDYCDRWPDVCRDVCKTLHDCALDQPGEPHFNRDESCNKKCHGFNMQSDRHCTLFAESVDLREGGRGTFYVNTKCDHPTPSGTPSALETESSSNNSFTWPSGSSFPFQGVSMSGPEQGYECTDAVGMLISAWSTTPKSPSVDLSSKDGVNIVAFLFPGENSARTARVMYCLRRLRPRKVAPTLQTAISWRILRRQCSTTCLRT
jgi:hypothetical protein